MYGAHNLHDVYKYLSCGHLCCHLGKWHLQAIATTGARFPDLDIVEIDSLFVFVADLWAEIYKYQFFSHNWPPSLNITFPGYRHYMGSIPWPWYYRNRFLFVFVADLWATTYKYLFWRLKWPPSWKIAFAGYCHYSGGRFPDLEIIQIDSCEMLSLHNFLW